MSRDVAASLLSVSTDTFERHVLPELRVVNIGRRQLIPVMEPQDYVNREAARALNQAWPVLERILTLRSDGDSTTAIAAALNADNVPTPTAARGEARGLVAGPGRWHPATVAKLCRNPHILRAAGAAAAA